MSIPLYVYVHCVWPFAVRKLHLTDQILDVEDLILTGNKQRSVEKEWGEAEWPSQLLDDQEGQAKAI